MAYARARMAQHLYLTQQRNGILSFTETSSRQMVVLLPVLPQSVELILAVLVSSSTNDYILVKLGDFGLSKVMDSDNAPASYAGTPQYQPPVRSNPPKRPGRLLRLNCPQEITRSHPTGIRWTKKCDVFSLGCEFLAILEGQN